MFFFGPNQNNRCCRPVTQMCRDCGIDIDITSSTNVARLCSQVRYTVTITNNSKTEIRCAVLKLNIPETLFADPSTITINGTPIRDGCLSNLEIGTLAPCETIVISYVATVMECKRFVKTTATLCGVVCCCFTEKRVTFESNCNVVQVCCCCACGTPCV